MTGTVIKMGWGQVNETYGLLSTLAGREVRLRTGTDRRMGTASEPPFAFGLDLGLQHGHSRSDVFRVAAVVHSRFPVQRQSEKEASYA